jgi:nucleotide-binding universal stress UspA family protein
MYKKILIAVDGSDTSQKALDAALKMAHESGGKVFLMHVVNELSYFSGHESYGAQLAEVIEIARKAGNKILDNSIDAATVAGVVAERVYVEKYVEGLGDIVAAAATRLGADLIVVGTHGRRGVGRLLLGSGAEQIIRFAPVPVLVIRAPDAKPAA